MEHNSMPCHHTYAHYFFLNMCYLLLSPIRFEMPAWVMAVCVWLSESVWKELQILHISAFFVLHLCHGASVCTQYSYIRRFRRAMVIIIALEKVQHIHHVLKGRNTFCVYVVTAEKRNKTSWSVCVQSHRMSWCVEFIKWMLLLTYWLLNVCTGLLCGH